MKRLLLYGTMALLLTTIFSLDCAAKKKVPIPPDPKFVAIQNISVLPIVDARAGKKAGVNLDKLQESIEKSLKRKHYSASAAGPSGITGEIAIEDVDEATPTYMKKLGSAGDRWVMVVFLDDVATKMTLGSTGNAELTGYLFDKDTGELMWKGKGVGQAGQGGLIGMPMKGMMKGEALDAAVNSLLSGIPNHPKA